MILRKRLNSNGNCKYLNKSEQKGENIFSPLKLYFFFLQKSFLYCRFGNVPENLIFANILEFVASRIQSSR